MQLDASRAASVGNAGLTYLASPYSSPDAAVRDARFRAVCKHAAGMMKRGVMVYAPIAHSHPIAIAGGLPTDWTFWKEYDTIMLKACSNVVVLMLDGWQESEGVQAECALARELGLPVSYELPE